MNSHLNYYRPMEQNREKIILVGIGYKYCKPSEDKNLHDIKESLFELESLTKTAGGQVVGLLSQNLSHGHSATLIGSGKIKEVQALLEEKKAQKVIIDEHLSGIQQRNLENLLQVPVLDRTLLILDIFAQRAKTKEGKLQVELAQLLDQKSRMVGAWLGSLSRLGGGIGTRGPGEKALEKDRRTLAYRIHNIQKKLKLVRSHRHRHRLRRKKNGIYRFALIGYTNAGKSCLFNALTKAHVDVEDKLFATLDPTTRKVFLPNAPDALITDTVGFIRKLPTQLIEAFKATLEEASDADALIHVIDRSAVNWHTQFDLTMKLLKNLNWSQKPIIHVFNKIDQIPLKDLVLQNQFQILKICHCFVSAKSGQGLGHLKTLMTQTIQALYQKSDLLS